MNLNEVYYRRTVSAVGFALLIWLALFEIFGAFVSFFLPLVLANIPSQYQLVADLIYWSVYIVGDVVCFLLPVLFLRLFIRKAGYSYQTMYAETRISRWLPFMICACIAISYSAAYISDVLMNWIGYSTSVFSTASADPKPYELVLEFISICIIPGFCEEFLFRGAILSNLLPFGRGKAIFISALLFSIMHRNASQIFYTFIAGIFLGIVYERTRSIWNCILIHIANNFLSFTQSVVLIRIHDQALAVTYTGVIELLVISLGVLSTVILARGFFVKRKELLQNGFFGRRLSACDEYADHPISGERARKLFMTPSMIVFLSLCVTEIVGLLLIVILGGKWLEFFG